MSETRKPTEGVEVYPPLPVPKARDREADAARPGDARKRLLIAAGGAALAGLVLGAVLRPLILPDGRIGDAERQAAADKARADKAEAALAAATTARTEAEDKLARAEQAQTELAGKTAELEKQAQESAAAQAKLQATVDKSFGIVSPDGDRIRLRLVDKVLFKTGDDQLTPRGKQIIDKVAVALKEMPDKQIWVHGHTDDQPIYIPPAPKPEPKPEPKAKKKGAKPAPPPPPPPAPRFATNWELSAARALTVVHHLQDVAKIDPDRLAALAFGQYQPVSSNRALNRRIEIVLYPKPALAKAKANK